MANGVRILLVAAMNRSISETGKCAAGRFEVAVLVLGGADLFVLGPAVVVEQRGDLVGVRPKCQTRWRTTKFW